MKYKSKHPLPSNESLAFAIDWLSTYEAGEDDDNEEHAKKVIAYLRGKIAIRVMKKQVA